MGAGVLLDSVRGLSLSMGCPPDVGSHGKSRQGRKGRRVAALGDFARRLVVAGETQPANVRLLNREKEERVERSRSGGWNHLDPMPECVPPGARHSSRP
jgi:hypothetical protein